MQMLFFHCSSSFHHAQSLQFEVLNELHNTCDYGIGASYVSGSAGRRHDNGLVGAWGTG